MAKKSHKKDVLHTFIRLQLLQVAVAAAGCQKIIAMREVCFCENLLRSSCQRSVMLHFFAKGQLSFTIFPFFLNLFCQWESSIFQFNILLKIKHEYFFLQLNLFYVCRLNLLLVFFLNTSSSPFLKDQNLNQCNFLKICYECNVKFCLQSFFTFSYILEY